MTSIATGSVLRAARNALGWSIETLAARSGVSVRTIIRYEATDDVPATRGGNLEALVGTMEAAGIEFIEAEDGAPGIVIRSARTG